MDRPAWFAWQPETSAKTALSFAENWAPDALVTESAIDAQQVLQQAAEPAVLVEVVNPFGQALAAGVDLNGEFALAPEKGQEALEAYISGVRSSLMAALESGADGVLYRLFGAEPTLNSPMQFGGLYLERERELLSAIADARFNVIYLEGGEELYLDVVADLPAHAIAWDEKATDISASEARKAWKGALACGLNSNWEEIWREFGGAGLVFSGKVSNLAEQDFSRIEGMLRKLSKD